MKDLIELFKDLRDSYIKPKEVWKDHIKFKSDLGEIKLNPKLKSKDQRRLIQNAEKYKKVLNFLEITLFIIWS